MRILLTGTSGQVGHALLRTLAPLGEVLDAGHARLDLSDRDAIVRTVREARPALIVNPAAFTAVDAAESREAEAMAINAVAPGILAEEARRLGAGLVHFSTDYVFDGEKPTPYLEDDPTGPLGAYGRSKLAGELAVLGSGGRAMVFRTAWVYSPMGKNFLRTILRLAASQPELRIVDDQHGTPTTARVLAESIAAILKNGKWEDGAFHLTCAGETTWCGFARAILEHRARTGAASPRLTPITTEQYPTPARRPRHSVLDLGKLRRAFGIEPPPWQAALADCMQEIQ